MGVVGAVRGGRVGKVVDVVSLVGFAIPSYWFGLVLATVFGVMLRVLPATGYVQLGESPARLVRLTRPALAHARADQQRAGGQADPRRGAHRARQGLRPGARARGVSERRVILLHVLRNAGTPIVTVLGLVFIGLLSGAVLVETVFVLPGLGSLAVAATSSHDVPVIQGVALVMTLFVVVANLVVELINAGLNPKVRS